MIYFMRGLDESSQRAFTDELNTSSERALGIICGAFIEDMLQDAIVSYLHRSKKITDEMFKTSGPLGTFSAKIHLGRLIGLFGNDAHRELTYIKDIRNRFAHKLSVIDFNNQQIAAWIENLTFGERYTREATQYVPREPGEPPVKPIGKRDWWFTVPDRAGALRDKRRRYLLSIGALSYGLAGTIRTQVPDPTF